jgi:hypothetical protein
MKRFACLFAFAWLTGLQLCAQVQLDPVGNLPLPAGHQFIIGITVTPIYGNYDLTKLMLFTTQEAYQADWEVNASGASSNGWQKMWDLTQFGQIVFEESFVVRHTGLGHADFYYTGGNSGNKLIGYNQSPPAIDFSRRIGDFTSVPNGLAMKERFGEPNSVAMFFSTSTGTSSSDTTPALVYIPEVWEGGITDPIPVAPANIFATDGPGKVSTGVGALAMGPDGLLNVLDTGDQRIIRYNADTFEYAGEFALGNTDTDRNTFTITPNGYIFTANLSSLGGSIYNYYTGEFVGTYGATESFSEVGEGGKTSLAVSDDGYVFAYNHLGPSETGDERIYVYDSNQLATVPEPTSAGLLAGSAVLAAGFVRRRRGVTKAGISGQGL